ncbi:MAG: glycosyltransferase family 39 protein [Vicinamibacteria bacterium]|nr:glycosyltransferase family 39 protein [Vicinamibacteria bacterium]
MARAVASSRGATFFRLTLLGLAARLAFLVLEPAADLVGDERAWTQWAEWIAYPRTGFSPLRFRLIYRPPLYVYFIALIESFLGSLTAVKIIQALVSSLLVPAVGRIGSRVFGARAGVVAALIAALYPELVWFSVHFWSETVFLILLMWAFERLVAADSERGGLAALTAGLLWGLATLTRETTLYFTPVAATWLALSRIRKQGRRRALLFLAAVVLAVLPWTARNWLLFRTFVPVSTASGLNLWQGNVPLSWREVHAEYDSIPGRIHRFQVMRQRALQAIIDRQPTWILEKLNEQMPKFWELDGFPLAFMRRGAYGRVNERAYLLAAIVVLIPYLALLAIFAMSVSTPRFGRLPTLLLLFLAYYNLVHVIAHGMSRYRLPVIPVLILFAAHGWIAMQEGGLRRFGARRLAGGATVALVLALSVAASVPEQWSKYRLWRRGIAEAIDIDQSP